MSIWCSMQAIGWDDMNDPDEPQPFGGEVRAYASGWSNHYPTTDGEVELPASVDTATIPVWCVPGNEDDFTDYPACGPWLRLGLTAMQARTWWTKDGKKPSMEEVHADVVMDEGAVTQLRDELTAWLERPKVHPKVVKP